MHTILETLRKGWTSSGQVAADAPVFLRTHGHPKTAEHCGDVASEARQIARRVGVSVAEAEAAGWLHDVSAIFPYEQCLQVAKSFGIDILPEEETYPMIVHQKISVVLARDLFAMTNESVLSAIGCHTTLKPNASTLDKVVFIADKIAWDQPGAPPYLNEMLKGLEQSLDNAVIVYLQYLWDIRDQLKVIHPWFREAYHELRNNLPDQA